ncbi:YdaU family protein [Gemmata sp. G18]|uniref:YdaU family protein n=1 Tax=Gemmata palustris TaxID=2822762 RepID=A0ABS5BX97_9BACT|nr:YdaU family protein [Gemmata palustris]MBP3958367.1 YdaU family protein [Gemmata palustris]
MTSIHTIPLHLGDFLSDTVHLSPAELGAYFRLIAFHYRLGPDGLPDDETQLRRVTGMDNKSWRSSRELILGFFEKSGDRRWVHARVQKTLFGIAQKTGQNRDKALKRWNSPNAAASDQQCHGNAIHKP